MANRSMRNTGPDRSALWQPITWLRFLALLIVFVVCAYVIIQVMVRLLLGVAIDSSSSVRDDPARTAVSGQLVLRDAGKRET